MREIDVPKQRVDGAKVEAELTASTSRTLAHERRDRTERIAPKRDTGGNGGQKEKSVDDRSANAILNRACKHRPEKREMEHVNDRERKNKRREKKFKQKVEEATSGQLLDLMRISRYLLFESCFVRTFVLRLNPTL